MVADRLPIVLQWVQQGCRPIPCDAGTKDASVRWTRYQREDPTRVDLHRWWTGRRQNNTNVALVLGPPPGGNLLALNINMKNGHDGPATLHRLGWTIPPTPPIRTPSGGLCYFFRVPDPQLYAFPFNTHADTGFDGIEFRGAKGYQLVPTSRTPEGVYTFIPPWTLDRFRADLAQLPSTILQAWAQLDQRAAHKFSPEILPAISSHSREPASAAALPTDLSLTSPSSSHKRSPARPAHQPETPNPPFTTITTVLTPDDNRVFVDGFDVYERECAEAICRWVNLPIDALDGTWPFHCRLPGHGPDHDPSATWLKTPSGYYLYKDWHPRSRHGLYTIPEVFAALTSRVLKQLPDPSRMAWRLRLMVEEGWLEPEPVRMKPVPEEASDLLRRYCEGFRFLVMCKSCHPKTTPGAATPFARAFAAHWCGIPKGSIWTLQQEATDAIVQALADAKRTILVQAYSFTSAPIAKALLDAHTRGVQVHVILDKSQRTEKYSSADFLANQGVPTMIDAEHAIAHNKVILIDGELVLTGSFNFTKAAQEKNAENLLIIRDPALAAQYTKNWEAHRQHSQSYVGRGVRP